MRCVVYRDTTVYSTVQYAYRKYTLSFIALRWSQSTFCIKFRYWILVTLLLHISNHATMMTQWLTDKSPNDSFMNHGHDVHALPEDWFPWVSILSIDDFFLKEEDSKWKATSCKRAFNVRFVEHDRVLANDALNATPRWHPGLVPFKNASRPSARTGSKALFLTQSALILCYCLICGCTYICIIIIYKCGYFTPFELIGRCAYWAVNIFVW